MPGVLDHIHLVYIQFVDITLHLINTGQPTLYYIILVGASVHLKDLKDLTLRIKGPCVS